MESNETENKRKQVLEDSLKGVENFLHSSYKILEYVYESDLQAALYNSIKNNLESCKWNHHEEDWVIFKNAETKMPCLVHCEQRYENNRIDIAVWDPTKDNATKPYHHKDLLLLIEIKYRVLAKNVIEAVKKDYEKLKNLTPEGKEYPKGLALTFTVAEKKLLKEGNSLMFARY